MPSTLVFTILLVVGCQATKEYTVEHRFSADTHFSTRGSIECTPSTRLQCYIYNDEDLGDSLSALTGKGYYYLRVCHKGKCVQSFIKQCLLIESKLNEIVELSVSASHEIVGVSLLTPLQYCNGTGTMENYNVHTKVEVIEPSPPAEPETSLYIKRVEAEKRRKLQGEGEDNRSFIAKYWMYIVPVLLLVMLNSQGEQGGE